MRLGPLLLCVPLAGCFQVELASGRFACERDEDCPPGQRCRGTDKGLRCVDPDAPAPPDGAIPDGAVPAFDLRAADGGDLAGPASPCQGEGRELAAGVWACRGNFAAGGAAALCRDPSYHLCGVGDAPLLAAWPACEESNGFYASQVPIERVGDPGGTAAYQIDCDIGMNVESPWGLLGCGREPGAKGGQVTGGSCPPLPSVLRCDRSDAWTCQNGTLAGTSHSRADTQGGGVLCCKMR